jgi:predicted SAM-dependent methyltransferase
MKLNLGCGNQKYKGYLNVDSNPRCKPDKIVDLEKRLPFKDNTFEEVTAEHIIEHISDTERIMKEIWRICKNGAVVKITVPHYKTEAAFTDPTHKRFFSPGTFEYFTKKRKTSYYFDFEYEIVNIKVERKGILRKLLHHLHLDRVLWNVNGDISVVLRVVK